jgi:hypothetical protein
MLLKGDEMKKLLILALFVVLFSSCEQAPFTLNLQNYSVNTYDLNTAWKMTAKNTSSFTYQARAGSKYALSPTEFEEAQGGNCWDFSNYLVYLLGPEASVAYLHTSEYMVNHAIVFYRGQYIEPQWYGAYYTLSGDTTLIDPSGKIFEVYYIQPYATAMESCTNRGSKYAH